jgi:hypothetical protein
MGKGLNSHRYTNLYLCLSTYLIATEDPLRIESRMRLCGGKAPSNVRLQVHASWVLFVRK